MFAIVRARAHAPAALLRAGPAACPMIAMLQGIRWYSMMPKSQAPGARPGSIWRTAPSTLPRPGPIPTIRSTPFGPFSLCDPAPSQRLPFPGLPSRPGRPPTGSRRATCLPLAPGPTRRLPIRGLHLTSGLRHSARFQCVTRLPRNHCPLLVHPSRPSRAPANRPEPRDLSPLGPRPASPAPCPGHVPNGQTKPANRPQGLPVLTRTGPAPSHPTGAPRLPARGPMWQTWDTIFMTVCFQPVIDEVFP